MKRLIQSFVIACFVIGLFTATDAIFQYAGWSRSPAIGTYWHTFVGLWVGAIFGSEFEADNHRRKA